MCHSHASVFYGLFVRTVDLVHAGMALKELERTFLAVDLICARRAGGKLSVDGAARVKDVPQEVWEMVKQELADIEVHKASRDLVRIFHCEECSLDETTTDFRDLLGCDECYEVHSDNGLRSVVQDEAEPIAALLRAHRLYQPASHLVHDYDLHWHDENACSAIAFAPPSSRNLLPSASPQSTREKHGCELNTLDPSIFSLPSNARKKIRFFCRLFRLEVVRPPYTWESAVDLAARRSAEWPMQKVVEPRWQFWATSECGP